MKFFHYLICSIILIQTNAICFTDRDCDFNKPLINCVWFECKPEACRSDEDCVKWGWTSHFCLNSKHTFLGAECIVKRESGALCGHDSNCISGKCNWIFGFLGAISFGTCQ